MKKKLFKLLIFIIFLIIIFFVSDASYFVFTRSQNIEKYIESIDVKETSDINLFEKGYYIKFKPTSKLNFYSKSDFDENGILRISKTVRISDSPFKKKYDNIYHPVMIELFALNQYNKYKLKGNQKAKTLFINHAYSLLNNIKTYDNSKGKKWAFLIYDFDATYMRKPWISAMAQGLALSVFFHAYNETKDKKFIEASRLINNSFFINMDLGGVSYYKDNYVVFEEYLTTPANHILNGFLFSWFGLYDYYKLTGDNKTKELLDKSLIFLEKNINKYDTGYWSLYDYPNLGYSGPSFKYHFIHIGQLNVMYLITHKKIFKNYAKKWKKNSTNQLDLLKLYINSNIWRLKRAYWAIKKNAPYKDLKIKNPKLKYIYESAK